MAAKRTIRIAVAGVAVGLGLLAQAQASPDLSVTSVAGNAAAGLTKDQAALLIEALGAADRQGIDPQPYRIGEAARLLQASDPVLRGQGAAQLRASALTYASAQHGGRVERRFFRKEWAIRPAPYDANAEFNAALSAGRLAEWIAGLPPPDPRYARLVAAYARYEALAAGGGWPTVAVRPSLKPGATGEGVEALRVRLAIEDPQAAAPPLADRALGSKVYDASLTEAVARAQARYGLTPDGVAGPATLAALNVPATQRLAQIRANLERWRWAPRGLPAYRVELNIADAGLALYDGGQPALTMRAIVGRASKRTPMFQDRISAVVLNPPWNVPAEIAAKEIWPKIRRDPGYMAREGFVVRPGGGLQQLPGPKCALGTIKFDLSNPFGVYLHDTPSHSLFARDSRNLSHGCMRLEKPNPLAKRLLQGDPAWSETRIDMALLSGSTVRIPLPQSAPVYVFYWTAFVDDSGEVQFRPDVYRWDEALLRLLSPQARPSGRP